MHFLLKTSGKIIQLDDEILLIESEDKKAVSFRMDPNAEVTTRTFQPINLLNLEMGQNIRVNYSIESNGWRIAKMIHSLAAEPVKKVSRRVDGKT